MLNDSEKEAEERAASMRCTIVVDEVLPGGRAANAAAVIALTLGKRHPELAGFDLIDASGGVHPGLIPIGIYIEFATRVREVASDDLSYVGVGLFGPRKTIGRLVGKFPLLK